MTGSDYGTAAAVGFGLDRVLVTLVVIDDLPLLVIVRLVALVVRVVHATGWGGNTPSSPPQSNTFIPGESGMRRLGLKTVVVG